MYFLWQSLSVLLNQGCRLSISVDERCGKRDLLLSLLAFDAGISLHTVFPLPIRSMRHFSPCVNEFTCLFPHPSSILWRVCHCFSTSSNVRPFSLCAPLCLVPSSLVLVRALKRQTTLFLVRCSGKYSDTACRFFSIPFPRPIFLRPSLRAEIRGIDSPKCPYKRHFASKQKIPSSCFNLCFTLAARIPFRFSSLLHYTSTVLVFSLILYTMPILPSINFICKNKSSSLLSVFSLSLCCQPLAIWIQLCARYRALPTYCHRVRIYFLV